MRQKSANNCFFWNLKRASQPWRYQFIISWPKNHLTELCFVWYIKDVIISSSRSIVSFNFAFCVFSYEEARDMLINEEILAPVYYIIGGTKSGQVKTMSQLLPVMLNFKMLVSSLNDTQTLTGTWTHRRITILSSSIAKHNFKKHSMVPHDVLGYFCIVREWSNNKLLCMWNAFQVTLRMTSQWLINFVFFLFKTLRNLSFIIPKQ